MALTPPPPRIGLRPSRPVPEDSVPDFRKEATPQAGGNGTQSDQAKPAAPEGVAPSAVLSRPLAQPVTRTLAPQPTIKRSLPQPTPQPTATTATAPTQQQAAPQAAPGTLKAAPPSTPTLTAPTLRSVAPAQPSTLRPAPTLSPRPLPATTPAPTPAPTVGRTLSPVTAVNKPATAAPQPAVTPQASPASSEAAPANVRHLPQTAFVSAGAKPKTRIVVVYAFSKPEFRGNARKDAEEVPSFMTPFDEVAILTQSEGGPEEVTLFSGEDGERDACAAILDELNQKQAQLVTWGGRSAILPRLNLVAMKNGLSRGVLSPATKYSISNRYGLADHLDLADAMAFFGTTAIPGITRLHETMVALGIDAHTRTSEECVRGIKAIYDMDKKSR